MQVQSRLKLAKKKYVIQPGQSVAIHVKKGDQTYAYSSRLTVTPNRTFRSDGLQSY